MELKGINLQRKFLMNMGQDNINVPKCNTVSVHMAL